MGKVELIGKIILQENITTLEENKIPKTFVINVPDPYKSYYSRFTDINKPTSIIFVTKKANSFENILRVTRKINSTYNLQLNGAKCEVAINSRKFNGIRVKGINRYTDIIQIQQYYGDAGFDFAKNEKYKNAEALIRVNRFFEIEEIAEGIYKSQNENDVFYVEVPRYMEWEFFKTITFEIKNNISDSSYDIAKGIFYVNEGITEILRIIKPKATIEFLKQVQHKYVEKLQ